MESVGRVTRSRAKALMTPGPASVEHAAPAQESKTTSKKGRATRAARGMQAPGATDPKAQLFQEDADLNDAMQDAKDNTLALQAEPSSDLVAERSMDQVASAVYEDIAEVLAAEVQPCTVFAIPAPTDLADEASLPGLMEEPVAASSSAPVPCKESLIADVGQLASGDQVDSVAEAGSSSGGNTFELEPGVEGSFAAPSELQQEPQLNIADSAQHEQPEHVDEPELENIPSAQPEAMTEFDDIPDVQPEAMTELDDIPNVQPEAMNELEAHEDAGAQEQLPPPTPGAAEPEPEPEPQQLASPLPLTPGAASSFAMDMTPASVSVVAPSMQASPAPTLTPMSPMYMGGMTPLPPDTVLPPASAGPSPGFQFPALPAGAGKHHHAFVSPDASHGMAETPAAALPEDNEDMFMRDASAPVAEDMDAGDGSLQRGGSAQLSPYSMEVQPPPLGHLPTEFSPMPQSEVVPGVTLQPVATPGAVLDHSNMDEPMMGSPAMGFDNPSPLFTKSAAVRKTSTTKPLTLPQSPSFATAARSAVKPSAVKAQADTSGATPAARVKTPAANASATPSSKTSSSPYVNVPSRYLQSKTPPAKTPVATPTLQAPAEPKSVTPAAAKPGSLPAVARTPDDATTAAAAAALGTKSTKRVSIHTPSMPHSSAAARAYAPTPYPPRPTSGRQANASQDATPEPVPMPQLQTGMAPMEINTAAVVPVPVDGIAAAERKAKAAGRLKAIHCAEQPQAAAEKPDVHVPSYMAPTAAFKASSKLSSKVEASGYDPRSLGQLKRDIATAASKKTAKAKEEQQAVGINEVRTTKLTPSASKHASDDEMESDADDREEAQYDQANEEQLVKALGGLEIAKSSTQAVLPLRGLPAPQGRHKRFDEEGKATESPQRVVLRGMPVATGKYKRWA